MIKRILTLVSLLIAIILMVGWVNSVPSPDPNSPSEVISIVSEDALIPKSIEKHPDIIDSLLKNSIIFCIGNTKAIVNDKLTDIDKNTGITPIERFVGSSYSPQVGEAFIPLEFLTKNLNIQYNVRNDGTVFVNNKSVNSSKIRIDGSVVYLSTSAIESSTGKHYFRYGEIIIISQDKIVYNSEIIKTLQEKFKNTKYPIIVNYYLDWESVTGYNGEGVRYKAFTNGKPIGEITAHQSLSLASTDNYNYVTVTEELNKTLYSIQDKIVAIGNCDFDPYARPASKLDPTSTMYKNIYKDVAKMISDQHLTADVVIKDLYELDITGDHEEAFLINATNDFNLDKPYYSFLILRKIVDGESKDYIINYDHTDSADFKDYHEFTVIDIMDVDNDGDLELIVCDALFESYEIKIIELKEVK